MKKMMIAAMAALFTVSVSAGNIAQEPQVPQKSEKCSGCPKAKAGQCDKDGKKEDHCDKSKDKKKSCCKNKKAAKKAAKKAKKAAKKAA